MKKTVSWLLRNPWVLGILAVVSVIQVIYYSQSKKNMIYAAILVMSGAIASFFSRNMVVILLFALGITHLVWFSQRNMFREGMETIDPTAEGENTVLVSTSEAEATSVDPTKPTAATAPETAPEVPPSTKPPSTVPDMLEIAQPTAMDRKLEDLQLKIDKLQTELSSIQTITAKP